MWSIVVRHRMPLKKQKRVTTSSNSSVFINANRFENKRDCLIFSSPCHIYSWQRNSNTKGFVFYFKEEFLACDILSEFPFFKVIEINLFEPEQAEAEKSLSYFQRIWVEFRGTNSYKTHIIQSLVLALLYYCKSLYERYRTQEKDKPRSLIIFLFDYLLINYSSNYYVLFVGNTRSTSKNRPTHLDRINSMSSGSRCPFTGGCQKSQPPHMPSNRDWWSNYLNLSILHQHSPQANPLGESFNYAEEFKSLDLAALRADIFELMTTSQDWWPADYELCTGFLSLVSATLTCSNFERGQKPETKMRAAFQLVLKRRSRL